jgi:biopolymer transport protein ExbB/TolQ
MHLEAPPTRRRVIAVTLVTFAAILMLILGLWMLVRAVSTSSANQRKLSELKQTADVLNSKQAALHQEIVTALATLERLESLAAHDRATAEALKAARAELQRLLEESRQILVGPTIISPGPTVTATVRQTVRATVTATPTCKGRCH